MQWGRGLLIFVADIKLVGLFCWAEGLLDSSRGSPGQAESAASPSPPPGLLPLHLPPRSSEEQCPPPVAKTEGPT